MERRQLFYLVDWVGYGPEERTWEPATNVEHAKDAVASFHRAHPQRPSPRDIPITRQQPLPATSCPRLPPTASNCLQLPLQELRRRGDHLLRTEEPRAMQAE